MVVYKKLAGNVEDLYKSLIVEMVFIGLSEHFILMRSLQNQTPFSEKINGVLLYL